jgi:hypothetical protein
MVIKNTLLLSSKIQKFDIFLPVIDETFSLQKTIKIIEKENPKLVSNYLIVLSKTKSSIKSKIIADKLKVKYRKKIKIIYQKEKFIGGALKAAINKIKSSHFILMASDLETDPSDVKRLISQSKKNPEKIITANRWLKSNSFKGYNIFKLILNRIFQFLFSFLFMVSLSDLTFAYRVYPTKLIKRFKLRESKHPILLETMLIPIKLDIKFIEIPSKWRSRREGNTNNTFLRNFLYIQAALRIFFSNKDNLVK